MALALKRRWIAGGVVAVVAVGVVTLRHHGGYQADLVLSSAAELSPGSPVWINGQTVGSVDHLAVNNGQAVVTVSLDKDAAPLHAGTTSRVEWVSAVGERVLTLYPGAATAPSLPSGALIKAPSSQVEVDQVLQTLDGPTRKRLKSVIAEAEQTLSGRQGDTQATLKAAGSAASALGQVLAAVGEDGPAIRSLVDKLQLVTQSASQHQQQIASTVQHLDATSEAIAAQESQLSSALEDLPGTLAQANTTLQKVPTAASATVGLLHDLQPATDQLPSVSADLAPVLQDVRPTVAQLRPLMTSAESLLQETPGLLDAATAVLPTTNDLLTRLGPAISFLRPYTPDGVGGLTTWGQAFAAYDGSGHYWAGMLAPGVNAVGELPLTPPTARQQPTPAPGQAEDQPWTDATGSAVR